MTSDVDILRSAKLLIDQHRPLAWTIADPRCRELRTKSDDEGARVYERIAARIVEFDDACLVAEH